MTCVHSVQFYSLDFSPYKYKQCFGKQWTKTMLTTGSCSSHVFSWLYIVTHHCLFTLFTTDYNVLIGGKNSRNNPLWGSEVHAAHSCLFGGLISKVAGGSVMRQNVRVLPWRQRYRQRARYRMCPGGLSWKIGQQVSHVRVPPPPYFMRKRFSLSNFVFPVNYIIGRSWLYTPIYADTVLYINCYIKTCQMGKKYNLSKIIRLDWQMLILNMSVYVVCKRFSWALILDSVEHLCFFYEI